MIDLYKDFFDEVKRFIIELDIEKENDVQGCTDEEIQSVEHQYGILPLAYKMYLKSFGRKFLFHFFDGEQFSYKDFDDIQEFAKKVITSTNFKLDKPIFPISHYRYQYFTFFYLNEKDDPEVWIFEEFPDEGDENVRLSSASFTDTIISFFKRTLHQHPFGFHFVSEEEKNKDKNIIKNRFLKWSRALIGNDKYIKGFKSENNLIADLHDVFREYFGQTKFSKPWWKFW